VRPFPGPGGKWQISTEGGVEPVWARNGRELFYRNGDKMMAVAVETKPTFTAAKPTLLFERHYAASPQSLLANYDVSLDGQRFLMIKASEPESAATQLNVVLNWADELRRLAPRENHDTQRRSGRGVAQSFPLLETLRLSWEKNRRV